MHLIVHGGHPRYHNFEELMLFKLAQVFEIDETVILQSPIHQSGVHVEAGTKGTVKAVYNGPKIIDVEFDGVDNPDFEEGIIQSNTLSIPMEHVIPEDDEAGKNPFTILAVLGSSMGSGGGNTFSGPVNGFLPASSSSGITCSIGIDKRR